jgi:hypothetical protein
VHRCDEREEAGVHRCVVFVALRASCKPESLLCYEYCSDSFRLQASRGAAVVINAPRLDCSLTCRACAPVPPLHPALLLVLVSYL